MARIMAMPFVYEDKQRHTLITVCKVTEGVRLSVNILDSRLAQKLALRNMFVFKNGSVKLSADVRTDDGCPVLQESLRCAIEDHLRRNHNDLKSIIH